MPVNSRLRSYYKDIGINQPAKETVLVLGSRTGESLERGKSMSRFNAASHVSYSRESKAFEFYPIKHWTVEDVWKLLTFAGSDKGLIPSYVGNFSDIVHFYADATGECVFNHRDTKQSEACSPRTGCFDCVRMTSDKSMEQLIQSDPEKYGYMKSLSKIRDFIWNIQWDWNRRNALGRTAYFGFSRIRPDVFSFDTCKTIFSALVTADYDEYQRAKRLREAIDSGSVPASDANKEMSHPQFKFVTPKDVITVDFLWSLHTFNIQPYEAVMIYREIWDGNENYMERLDGDSIPKEPVKRTPQPAGYHLFVGDKTLTMEERISGEIGPWDTYNGFQNLGLRNVMEEFCEVSYPVHHVSASRDYMMLDCDIGDHFDVSLSKAIDIVEYPDMYLNLTRKRLNLPQTAAIELLSRGVVKLGKGKEYLYHEMCLRAQKYHGLRLTGGMSWADIEKIKSTKGLQLLKPAEYKQHKSRLYQLYIRWWIWLLVIHVNKEEIGAALAEEELQEKWKSVTCILEDAQMWRFLARKKRYQKSLKNWKSFYSSYRQRERDCIDLAIERASENNLVIGEYLTFKLYELSCQETNRNSRYEIAYLKRLERRCAQGDHYSVEPVSKQSSNEVKVAVVQIKAKQQLALF